jgi:hypothetical protein
MVRNGKVAKMLMEDIDFLIIGATKSATTWLQRSLKADPSVVMPAGDLELHYFSREFVRGNKWYLSHFPEKKEMWQVVGERSNSYLDTPQVASRVYNALPHVKLIAQLRNPVDRAYSDYCMLYRRGEVAQNIDNYLDPRIAHKNRFLNGGFYSLQIRDYLVLYPPSQLLILLFDEMKIDPIKQLVEMRNFLGLSDSLPTALDDNKVKDKATPIVNPQLRRRFGWLRPTIAPFRNTQIFGKLRNLVAREIEYPELYPDLRKRMVDYYAPEVDALRKLLGKALPGW